MSQHRITRLADLPQDSNKAFKIGGTSVLLCRTVAGVFALENRCTHQLQPLEGGKMRGPYLFCPKHGQRFDLRTGATAGALTKSPLPVYPVVVDDEGNIDVSLPD
jgi:3-phenylpropionate/trans-cinnamate dioxygenase ferredoxin component